MNISTTPRPLQHVKTGDFSEEFAQEAADRRKAYTRTRSCDENHAPQDRFLPFSRRQGRDVEEFLFDKKSHKVEERKLIANSFRLSCYRRPHKKNEQMVILGTEAEGQSHNTTGKDLRWICLILEMIRETRAGSNPFRSFIDTLLTDLAATADVTLSAEDREDIGQWLLGLEMKATREVFNGRVMEPLESHLSLQDHDSNTMVSCAFFCFPYIRYGPKCPQETGTATLSTRPLVQALYRSESPLERELQQASVKFGGSGQVMHVSQFWGFIMNNNYFASFSPSQVHSRPGCSITTLPLDRFPPSFRLHLYGDLDFLIYWEECPTWFRFLAIVHRIYSQLLQMHVDVELCTYHSYPPHEIIDAYQWPLVIAKRHPTVCDIFVKLPVEALEQPSGTHGTGRLSTRRFGPALDTFGISWQTDAQSYYRDDIVINSPIRDHLESQIRDYTDLRSDLYQKQLSTTDDVFSPLPSLHRSRSPTSPLYVGDREDPYARRHQYDSGKREESDDGSVTRYSNRRPCSWPLCFGESTRSRTIGFWSPRITPFTNEETLGNNTNAPQAARNPETQAQGKTPPQEGLDPSARSDERSCYLRWKVRPDGSKAPQQGKARSVRSKSDQQNTDSERARAPGDSSWSSLDDMEEWTPLIMMHRDLTNKNDSRNHVYISQTSATLKDVQNHLRLLDDSVPLCVRNLVQSAIHLSEDFIETGLDGEVEMKLCGSLFWILKKCQDHNPTKTQMSVLAWAADRTSSLLVFSSSIRAGALGGHDRLFLLVSLVESFKSIVLAFCLLNDYLRLPAEDSKSTNDREPRPTTGKPTSALADDPSRDYDEGDSASDDSNYDLIIRLPSANLQSTRPPPTRLPSRRLVPTPKAIEKEFNAAGKCLLKAKEEIIFILDSDKQKDLEEYSTVGADQLVIAVLKFLAKGDTGTVTPVDLYREYCSELRLSVRDAPKRLLLDDLDRIEEELDVLIITTEQQQDLLYSLQRHHHFRTWTGIESWGSALRSIETESLDKIDSYRDLKVRVESMRKQVLRQIEVKQDGNNKAILVFTIVTVVFLPLSFVSSFFGMNTADIRDMDHSQSLFWAVSIPVTVIIVSLAMGVAYQGSRFKERLSR